MRARCSRHDVLVWLGCAGAFEADYQKSLRALFEILRARQVRFGVLSKEKCTGDPAKRTGNGVPDTVLVAHRRDA